MLAKRLHHYNLFANSLFKPIYSILFNSLVSAQKFSS